MIRPLARRINIRVLRRLKHKIRSTVLQRKSTPLGNNTSAKSGVVADDKAARVALRVGGGEINGVGGVGEGVTVADRLGCFFGVENFGAGGEVGGGEEFGDGDGDDIGVGDEECAVGEGQAEGFYYCVEVSVGWGFSWVGRRKAVVDRTWWGKGEMELVGWSLYLLDAVVVFLSPFLNLACLFKLC